ncbi:MAG: lysylphosphatidylglycerol synthase transmembrane domain-containing protein [Bacteroidota bacterium]|nr:lysylphosphatidylglycerol synthase transmembrane domain-containing protein [Bacteroidota bacterium]
MTLRKGLTTLVFFGIGLGLFWLAMQGVEDPEALKRDMRSAQWWGIAASFVMGYLAIVSRGLRWNLLLAPMGHHPSPARSVHAVAFSYFATAFVPRSGEVARCAALNQTDDIPVDQLLGTVITERVVDFLMLFGLVAFALLTNLDAFLALMQEAQLPAMPTLIGAGVAGLAGCGALWWISQQQGRSGLLGKMAGFLQGIGTGIRSVLAMEKRGLFLFHTLFIWVMYFLMSYVLFKAIPAVSALGLTDAVLVMVAGGFGMVLPAPGGIGSYHWAVSLGFAAVGFSGDVGFAVANVVWLTQTAMIVITGGLGYLMLFLHRMQRG